MRAGANGAGSRDFGLLHASGAKGRGLACRSPARVAPVLRDHAPSRQWRLTDGLSAALVVFLPFAMTGFGDNGL